MSLETKGDKEPLTPEEQVEEKNDKKKRTMWIIIAGVLILAFLIPLFISKPWANHLTLSSVNNVVVSHTTKISDIQTTLNGLLTTVSGQPNGLATQVTLNTQHWNDVQEQLNALGNDVEDYSGDIASLQAAYDELWDAYVSVNTTLNGVLAILAANNITGGA
jgi:hypothetical protein